MPKKKKKHKVRKKRKKNSFKKRKKIVKKRKTRSNKKNKKKVDKSNTPTELVIKTKPEWIKGSLANKLSYQKKYNDSIKNNNEFWKIW